MAKAAQDLRGAVLLSMLVVVLSAGCAGGKPPSDAEMEKRHKIDCSGTMKGWDECAEKAIELCGENRYEVLWRDSRYNTFRSMTIRCTAQEHLVTPEFGSYPGVR